MCKASRAEYHPPSPFVRDRLICNQILHKSDHRIRYVTQPQNLNPTSFQCHQLIKVIVPRLLGAEPNAQHHYPCNLSWLTGRNFRGFQKSFRTCRRAVTLLWLNSPHSRFDFRTSFQTRCRRLQFRATGSSCCSTMSASAGTECIFGCASHMGTKRTRVFLIDDDRATRGTGFLVLRNWPPPMRCCSDVS